MGWPVSETKRSSMWEFFSAYHGFVEANTPKQAAKLTDSEADDLFAWIERDTAGPRVLSTMTYDLDGLTLVPSGRVTFEVK